MEKETILVTSALPYANGPIHFGHIAGAYLPADVFVRYHRLKKNDIVYICGTDEYGVAITIGAEKAGRSPREHTDIYHKVIKDIFKKFNIQFDHFSRTTTELHRELSQKFFTELHTNRFIEDKMIEQHFCPKCRRFLADRFIEGTCYLCGQKEARGDECPGCGAWLDPLKLKDVKCKVCGTTPLIQSTRHWFLKLGEFKDRLKEWIDRHPYWKPNVVNTAKKQLEELTSRPITRDLSWGIPVPLPEAKDKVLYVWFDAPIGYMDATMEWAQQTGQPDKWKHYWQNPKCRIVNFIGKDNIPFHLLVWPAMIMGQTTPYTLAENIPANEFYNLEGRQFSKSEGWYVELDDFFKKYSSDQIRYAIAANAPETKDSDFNWRDFQKFNNADLANVLGNLVHRTLTFTLKNFGGKIPPFRGNNEKIQTLLQEIDRRQNAIAELYQTYQLRKASYEVIDMARLGNRFFDESEPWNQIKKDKTLCGEMIFGIFRLLEKLSVCLWPILPSTAEAIFEQIGIKTPLKETGWDFSSLIPSDGSQSIGEPRILFGKIEDEEIEKEIRKLKDSLTLKNAPATAYDPLKEGISYEDFSRMDIRVGQILEASPIKKSDKLLQLKIDLGVEKRQIVAGIAQHYKADELPGKKVAILVNLAPRKLMGIESSGMVLAASFSGQLRLLDPGDLPPGATIR
ncbi:MAG: methionine--tRNA ligase [Candidatus Aureabacteria bacterium]|nr:methionine--tRNA ligase [Candidatus Auribacterota bacterium]